MNFRGWVWERFLVKQLVNAAQNDGLARLEAVVNRNNRPMQRLIHKLGLPTDEDYDSTSVIMTVFLNGGAAVGRFKKRWQLLESNQSSFYKSA